jgi:hypothetical protein
MMPKTRYIKRRLIIGFLTIASVVLYLLGTSLAGASHTPLKGVHAALPCSSCHGKGVTRIDRPASLENRARGCAGCHQGYDALFDRAMTTRARERQFVEESFGKADPHFYQKNCQSCHVRDCLDCHGNDGHHITSPGKNTCLSCHKGYFVGTDYYGMAPREDNLRYQRGKSFEGENFLKMLPDVHAEKGMECGDCHSMKSLVSGEKSSKKCVDCHKPSDSVLEHGIPAHLRNVECYACHSAWAAQEYGTFHVRFSNSPSSKYFRVKRRGSSEYIKSAYLKMQNKPPLAINNAGKISPIRPQFIVYFSEISDGKPVGQENRLLAAQWKAFFPHTIRRGTILCDGCHGNARRFVLEEEKDKIYQLQRDGMTLNSFWDRAGQKITNGCFMKLSRFAKMSLKSCSYRKAYVRKWIELVEHVEDSSKQ